MHLGTLTIVGVGLLGGSIAMAARTRGVAARIRGVDISRENLDHARAVGVIDDAFLEAGPACAEADLAVFCIPVDHIADGVLQAAGRCGAETTLTDVGSTKGRIVHEVEAGMASPVAFVGSHPLAGSEKQGVDFAHATMFHNRLVVITPTARTPAAAVDKVRHFWQAVGARVKTMSPEDHDRAVAFTSHLPHLLASALAGILPGDLAELTATGFRDTTRVAAGDPGLWSAIFRHNHDAVLSALDRLEARLREFREAFGQGHTISLEELLTQAKRVRDALGS